MPQPYARAESALALGQPPGGLGDAVDNHFLGATFLAVGTGAAIGTAYTIDGNNGLYGGIAGGLFGGAAINIARAIRAMTKGDKAEDKEAVVAGTYALVGIGIASYILWKTRKTDGEPGRLTANKSKKPKAMLPPKREKREKRGLLAKPGGHEAWAKRTRVLRAAVKDLPPPEEKK
jgi:hypothetical protein